MKLEIFDTIDETIALLETKKEEYQIIRKELKYTLLSILDRETVIDITSRIKSNDSLKEKIIRNRYYLKYETPEAIVNNFQDIIGLKIDCRFIDEEFLVYKQLKEYFTLLKDDGYYTCEKYEHIALDLEPHQPQSQQNGFAIYRIDGYYLSGDHQVKFELQIKSLVNTFWGDIEHKLVYKNTNYMALDFFAKDLLASIKANLTIVDRQLRIIYDAMDGDMNMSSKLQDRISFESLISKTINDICAEKLRASMGFGIDIRETSDILGHYIYKKNIQSASNGDQILNLVKLLDRLHSEEINFEEKIQFKHSLSDDIFYKTLGEHLLSVMNNDFEWFVFFRILFAIEPGKDAEDFVLFLDVYKNYLLDESSFDSRFEALGIQDAAMIRDDCLSMFACGLCKINSVQIVHNKKIEQLHDCFSSFLDELEERIIDYKDFNHYEDAYREQLHSSIKDIFQ